jgi:hypothetical protein
VTLPACQRPAFEQRPDEQRSAEYQALEQVRICEGRLLDPFAANAPATNGERAGKFSSTSETNPLEDFCVLQGMLERRGGYRSTEQYHVSLPPT